MPAFTTRRFGLGTIATDRERRCGSRGCSRRVTSCVGGAVLAARDPRHSRGARARARRGRRRHRRRDREPARRRKSRRRVDRGRWRGHARRDGRRAPVHDPAILSPRTRWLVIATVGIAVGLAATLGIWALTGGGDGKSASGTARRVGRAAAGGCADRSRRAVVVRFRHGAYRSHDARRRAAAERIRVRNPGRPRRSRVLLRRGIGPSRPPRRGDEHVRLRGTAGAVGPARRSLRGRRRPRTRCGP